MSEETINMVEFTALDHGYWISENNVHETGNIVLNIISKQINSMLRTHN